MMLREFGIAATPKLRPGLTLAPFHGASLRTGAGFACGAARFAPRFSFVFARRGGSSDPGRLYKDAPSPVSSPIDTSMGRHDVRSALCHAAGYHGHPAAATSSVRCRSGLTLDISSDYQHDE